MRPNFDLKKIVFSSLVFTFLTTLLKSKVENNIPQSTPKEPSHLFIHRSKTSSDMYFSLEMKEVNKF